jgi:hypothetical protein
MIILNVGRKTSLITDIFFGREEGDENDVGAYVYSKPGTIRQT